MPENKTNTSLTEDEKPKILSPNSFPVVGIGASAGGLDAFKALLRVISADSGMAYVLVQHLDPTHQSVLPEILQKVTKLPVLEISDEIKVEPNHIYILPSNKMLVANDGVLQLSQRPAKNKEERNMPIDMFFRSLAEVHQAQAIGVVLSGTGTDGTLGLKAIKNNGGLTFAQDNSAAYEGMPDSAVHAGVADFVLPPEAIPQKLQDIKNSIHLDDAELKNVSAIDNDIFKQILFLLRTHKGTDFTYYKQTTIRRRILRRMALNQKLEPAVYLSYLQENIAEQDALYQDLLIPVTEFFRDKKVFDNLRSAVFPHILNNKAPAEPLRVWVAACSTGEEAYSIAICLKEYLGDSAEKLQIFATDISEPAILKARKGYYTKSDVDGMAPGRLQNFFTRSGDGYLINKGIRDVCVFAIHNFLKDPPFRKIDLVTCRNVLIYMEPYLQKKALTTFHYSLNPKGFLLLGRSETATGVQDLFAIADKSDKLFTRKDGTGKYLQVARQRSAKNKNDINIFPQSENLSADFQKVADDIMLSRYTPAGVVVNEANDIVHFRGNTSAWLAQAPGKPSHNIFKMAKNGLGFELRNILLKVRKAKTTVTENLSILVDGEQCDITIEAMPLPNVVDPHYLILFHYRNFSSVLHHLNFAADAAADGKDMRILQLEQELVRARESMHNITEDQEATNEVLQNDNEDLMSTGEELQSLNEELETSKEELQSTIEELTVLNQEIIGLNEEVTKSRDTAEIARKKMEVQAAMVHNLLMNAPGFVCTLTGTDHVYGIVNDLYQQLFGKRKIQGKPIMVALPELEGQGFDILLDKVYEMGEPYVGIEVPITLARDEGLEPEKRYFNFSYQPMYDENSSIFSILVFGYEVTEEVNAKNRNLESQKIREKELEDNVQQRTNELSIANGLMVQKNEELVKINKELESFAYVSSHDLQEPLRKIQTFAGMILKKDHAVLSEEGKDYFQRMQKAALRMEALIDDLLAYSRANNIDVKYEKVDLNKMLDDVRFELSETILKSNAVIETGELCTTNFNPFQFRQVMTNLITNSLKFSKPGVLPYITINSKTAAGLQLQIDNPLLQKGKLLSQQQYCNITFADNGIGFDPLYNDRIFELFQRLHGKDEYQGTGIGLAIVKKIVENHNGIITASGEVDKGATFNIYIPAN